MWYYTSYPYAAFAAHAINSLEDGIRCCAHDCAPCGALRMLHNEGRLDGVLQPYINQSGGGWDWWDDKKRRVIWKWIADRICDPETCDYLKDTENEEKDRSSSGSRSGVTFWNSRLRRKR